MALDVAKDLCWIPGMLRHVRQVCPTEAGASPLLLCVTGASSLLGHTEPQFPGHLQFFEVTALTCGGSQDHHAEFPQRVAGSIPVRPAGALGAAGPPVAAEALSVQSLCLHFGFPLRWTPPRGPTSRCEHTPLIVN